MYLISVGLILYCTKGLNRNWNRKIFTNHLMMHVLSSSGKSYRSKSHIRSTNNLGHSYCKLFYAFDYANFAPDYAFY